VSRLAFSTMLIAALFAWLLVKGSEPWDSQEPVPNCPSTVDCRTPAPPFTFPTPARGAR
jgi:hypothetical protein